MNRIKYLLPLLGLAFAASVYAFSGSHNYLNIYTSTSDGHTYRSEYRSTGSFSFDGTGSYDKAKVNLKGTLSVSEVDGIPVSESYCASLTGTLKANGGQLKTTLYSDTNCNTVQDRESYSVVSYSEDSIGNFTLVTKNEYGVVYTTSGVHSLTH